MMAVASLPAAAQSSAPATPNGRTPVASAEGISEYAFPNGLRVLLYPDTTRATVSVNVTYFAGSRHEGYGETGMAHFLEHLLARGTQQFPDVPAAHVQRRSTHNATTGFDFTNYFETLPAGDANLQWALELEQDRMTNGSITKELLATEFSIVLNERELWATDAYRSAYDRLWRAAYQWHPYGRPTIGAESDVRNIPIERFQAFYRRYYQPDNAMLVIAGRFDPAKALAMVERTLGAVPRPTRSAALGNLLPAHYTAEPAQDGESYTVMRRNTDSQWILMGYHVPGVAHPDFAPVAVLADVLFSNPSGRLYKAIVDKGRAVLLDGTAWQLADPTLMTVRANLRRDQSLDSVRAIMLAVIDSARTSTYTNDEVARARTSLLRNIQLDLNNPSGSFNNRISDWASFGDWRLLFFHRDRLAQVTPADVQRVARLYLKPTNATTVAVVPTPAPDRAEVPANPNVATMMAGYRPGAATQGGEVFDASPKNIDLRTTRTRLPNGMYLSMLPKETRGNRVVALIQLRHGTAKSLAGKTMLSQLTGFMLNRGTTQLTRQQVIDSLSKLTSAVGFGPTASGVTVSIETTRPNLLPVLNLVAQQLRSPRLDSADLVALKRERLLVVENSRANPVNVADNAVNRRIVQKPKDHPLNRLSFEESIEEINAVTIAAVRAHHRSHFGAGAADMAIVGDFDRAEVQAAVTRLLGDWRSPQPYERLARAYAKTDSSFESIEMADKPNAAYVLGVTMPISDADPDYPALALAHYILAGSQAASRVFKRLRGQEGLTYTMASSLNAQPQDRYATWIAQSISAPQNIERLQRAWREEIDRALRDGFTQTELDEYRPGLLESYSRPRSNDVLLAGILQSRRFAGRTMAYDEDLERKIAALTPDQVTAALRKYLSPKDIVIARAGSFAPKP